MTTNLKECGACPIFASYTVAFAIQLRKMHGKTSVMVAEECKYLIWYSSNKEYMKTSSCFRNYTLSLS